MSLAEAQSLEVESPLPPARAPNMLLVSLMRQAPVMTRLYRAAEDSRVARGEALRKQGHEMVARWRQNTSGKQDWNQYNGHLQQIALANVTGRGGGADWLTREEINSYGVQKTC